MNCNRCQKLFHEYLDQSLPSRLRTAIEDHLRSCDGCREALVRERRLFTSLPGLLSRYVEGLKLRPGIQHDVVKALESRAPSPKFRRNYRRVLLRPALAFGAAASLLLVAGVLVLVQNHPREQVPPVVEHPKSYVMCMATTYADEAKTDWIERRLIVEMKNGVHGYLKIIAKKPPKETRTKEEMEEQS